MIESHRHGLANEIIVKFKLLTEPESGGTQLQGNVVVQECCYDVHFGSL